MSRTTVAYTAVIDSPTGMLTINASDAGLHSLTWPANSSRHTTPGERVQNSADHPVIAETTRQLVAYFQGALTSFELLLAPQGTEMQHAVWRMLTEIPHGQTWSYGRLASALQRPTAVRAVANAVGRNPIGIIVPCHRVVGADGTLTGFAGGLDAKRWLLEHEGALPMRSLPLG